MRQFIIGIGFFTFTGLLPSCNTDKKPDIIIDKPAETIETCFASIGKDTVLLALKTTGNKVTGTLGFNLYEKDLNEGTLEGEIKGDTIIASYTFYSEGVSSIREVVFLKKNDQLIEGFGETITADGKQIFKSRSTLSFDNSMVLTATACDK